MKKQAKKRIIVGPMLASLAVMLAMLLTTVSLAAYTNQGYKKGVATTNGSDAMFSANVLDNYADLPQSYTPKTVSLLKTEGAETYAADVYVYNHAQSDQTLFNQLDITYSITFTLAKRSGVTDDLASGYAVTDNDNTSHAYTNSTLTLTDQTLAGKKDSSLHYGLVIPASDVDKCSITVTVTPSDDASLYAAGQNKLGGTLQFALYSVEQNTFSWTEKFSDAAAGHDPAEYDALNYEVSGSAGKGTIVLGWNPTYVEPDPHLASRYNTTDNPTEVVVNTTDHTITLTVDATKRTYYSIPFYRLTDPVTTETWTALTVKTTGYVWVDSAQQATE
jgi:hypothetical protein